MAETSVAVDVAKGIQSRLNLFLSKEKGVKSVMAEKPQLIRTGIANLDAMLGGGIILGGIVQLVGRAGSGKSSLCAKFISSFQKNSNGKCLAIYIDAETTMSKYRLSQLGVNYPPIDPISDVTLESVFDIIDSVIEFKKNNKDVVDIPTIIVWDSIANTLSKKEMECEDPKEVIGFKARLLSIYLPRITSALQEYKITVVAINQLRDAVSIGVTPTLAAIKGMKQGDTIPGGRALQFATSQLIYMQDSSNLEERIYGFDGKEVEMYCIKNKAFPPLIKTKTCFSYMGGYSNFWSAFTVLKEDKLITTAGAWYSIAGYDKKFQGSNVSNLYINDEGFRGAFDNTLREYIRTVVDKYTNQLESCNIDDIITSKMGSGIGAHILDDPSIKKSMDKLSEVAQKTAVDAEVVEAQEIQESKERQKAYVDNLKAEKKPKAPKKEPTHEVKTVNEPEIMDPIPDDFAPPPPPPSDDIGGLVI